MPSSSGSPSSSSTTENVETLMGMALAYLRAISGTSDCGSIISP